MPPNYTPPAETTATGVLSALTAVQAVTADYLTEPELAVFVKRSERTLGRWRRQRISPPFVKVGSSTLYPVDGVRSWLKRREISVDAKTRNRRT